MTVAVTDGLVNVDLALQVTVSLRVLGIVIPVAGGPITITGLRTTTGDAVINIDSDDSSQACGSATACGSAAAPPACRASRSTPRASR